MGNNYKFNLPTNTKSIIKVMGVGGGGSNAVKYMYNKGIKDVEFIICNTDLQALNINPVPNKLQIGKHLTEGLGAGANPEKGREAALENKEDIRNLFSDGTKMLFITAGMGGGTGTGAAPVIAEIAKELGILTVAIITAPFSWEGRKKIKQAQAGIDLLKKNCDTVLIISNDRLSEIYDNLKITEAFAEADNILATAAKGIAEIISVHAEVNVDFEDVRTVMRNSGAAVMGSARAEGENRAMRAAQDALNSPLLNNQDIKGAQKILLSIMSGEKSELQMHELKEITEYIEDRAGDEAYIIFGHGIDPNLGDSIRLTIIATGFQENNRIDTPLITKKNDTPKEEPRSVVFEVHQPAIKPMPTTIEPTFYQQEKPIPEPPKEEKPVIPAKPQKIVYNLEDDVEENITPNLGEESEEEVEKKLAKLRQEADERLNRLRNISEKKNYENYKERFDIPAYLRRDGFGNKEDK